MDANIPDRYLYGRYHGRPLHRRDQRFGLRSRFGGLLGNPGRAVVMPIRMEGRDKPRDRALGTQDPGLGAPLADDSETCYTARRPMFRMLCGLSRLLLAITT